MTATTKQWDAGPSQLKFFNAHHPRNLFCGGWGSGKSLIGSRKAALRSIQYPNSLGLISANTVRQLHHSTLSEFWKVLRRDYGLSKNEDYVFNKQPPKRWGVQSSVEDHDGVLTYRWGAQVVVRSLHHYINMSPNAPKSCTIC